MPRTDGLATASHRSSVVPSRRRTRRWRPRSERTSRPAPLARAGSNLSRKSPSRPQTVITRAHGHAAARGPARSSPSSQRTRSGSTASPGAWAPLRCVALRVSTPSGTRGTSPRSAQAHGRSRSGYVRSTSQPGRSDVRQGRGRGAGSTLPARSASTGRAWVACGLHRARPARRVAPRLVLAQFARLGMTGPTRLGRRRLQPFHRTGAEVSKSDVQLCRPPHGTADRTLSSTGD